LQVRQYFHRYTEDALDLCDVLGSYVPGGKVKLDEVANILGLPGKPEGIDGSRVEEMVLAGQIEEVARYCESDVLEYLSGLACLRVVPWVYHRQTARMEREATSRFHRDSEVSQSSPVRGGGNCGRHRWTISLACTRFG
jgi:predicted PolB exonuclease-like 3'-5' exonuclease